MKKFLILALLLPVSVTAAEQDNIGLTAHNLFDTRTSLGLSAKVKHRQLVHMRAQLMATQAIIGLLAEENFDRATKIVQTKLGMSDEMKQIYERTNNEDFKQLGLAFHNSADELGTALQTKDMKKSLQALSNTMKYCVQCHNKFRQ
ncbi:MAG: cytochrome c [Gallionella sp.]